jgi:hypothetical protein
MNLLSYREGTIGTISTTIQRQKVVARVVKMQNQITLGIRLRQYHQLRQTLYLSLHRLLLPIGNDPSVHFLPFIFLFLFTMDGPDFACFSYGINTKTPLYTLTYGTHSLNAYTPLLRNSRSSESHCHVFSYLETRNLLGRIRSAKTEK